ncbi:MAG: glycosyltransferase family 4 protein [Ignavibacteriales bacterium]
MTTDAVGGVWTYALDLAGELATSGVQTTLAIMGPSAKADQLRAAKAVDGLALIETGLPLDWTAASPEELKVAADEIAALARGQRAEVIHLNSPTLAAYVRFHAPVVGACHSCVGTWWGAVRQGDLPQDFRWRTEALARAYARCDALVAPSRAFASATAATYGVKSVAAVHNGRRPIPTDQPKSDSVIFTAGRLWDAGKNVAMLDAAAAHLDAPVYAAGPLESPTGGRVTLPNLRLLGRLGEQDVADWMAHAQIFVSTALYEPFGLSVLEAAQAGCALVLSDIPTFRELWDDAALFVAPNDVEALTATLGALLNRPARAAMLGRAARERAKRYTVEAMGRGVLDLYRSLMPAEAAA